MEATKSWVLDCRGLREKAEKYSRTSHICQLSNKKKGKYIYLLTK